MRKFLWFLPLLLLAFFLTGCKADSYSTLMSVNTQTATSFSMRYQKFNGTKTYTVKVPEGETRELAVSIVSKSGSLGVTVAKGDEHPVYRGQDLPTCDFSVTLSESGSYTVTLSAKDHVGSYLFSWD